MLNCRIPNLICVKLQRQTSEKRAINWATQQLVPNFVFKIKRFKQHSRVASALPLRWLFHQASDVRFWTLTWTRALWTIMNWRRDLRAPFCFYHSSVASEELIDGRRCPWRLSLATDRSPTCNSYELLSSFEQKTIRKNLLDFRIDFEQFRKQGSIDLCVLIKTQLLIEPAPKALTWPLIDFITKWSSEYSLKTF